MSQRKMKVILTDALSKKENNIVYKNNILGITTSGIAESQKALILCESYTKTGFGINDDDIVFYDANTPDNPTNFVPDRGLYYVHSVCYKTSFVTCISLEKQRTEVIALNDEKLHRVVASSDAHLVHSFTGLPEIDFSFVKKYVGSQGKIKEVMIETYNENYLKWNDIVTRKTGTVIISLVKNADCVVSKGITNSSRFRATNKGVDLKQVMNLKTTSKEKILSELKYFIENDIDDEFVKQWCLNIACELYTIFKTFKKDKIKKEMANSTALQVYKEGVPMQIFFNKSSTTVNIIQTLDNLLKDVGRNIFELNEPYTATIVGYSNKNFTISSDEDFVEFTFEEIELL
jgi:hypothetical protein